MIILVDPKCPDDAFYSMSLTEADIQETITQGGYFWCNGCGETFTKQDHHCPKVN